MLKRLLTACFLLAFAFTTAPVAVSARSSPPTSAIVAYHASYFDSEDAAQRHCPRDIVVWLNIPSGIYHYRGERWYARTRHGTFVCEKEAILEGDRASRNGQ
jgi:hypothetical protein